MSHRRSQRSLHRSFVMASVLLVAACSSSGSDAGRTSGVTVTDAWARSTASLAKQGAVYLTIESSSPDAITGVSVAASVAQQATMHESMMDGTMMSMEPLDRVELPAATRVVFEPGKKHIMLEELAKPLVAGATFTLHLTFAKSAAIDTTVTVRD